MFCLSSLHAALPVSARRCPGPACSLCGHPGLHAPLPVSARRCPRPGLSPRNPPRVGPALPPARPVSTHPSPCRPGAAPARPAHFVAIQVCTHPSLCRPGAAPACSLCGVDHPGQLLQHDVELLVDVGHHLQRRSLRGLVKVVLHIQRAGGDVHTATSLISVSCEIT